MKIAIKRHWSTRTSYSNIAKDQSPAELDSGSSANARRLEHELDRSKNKLSIAHKSTMVSLNHRRKQMEKSMLKYSERMRAISDSRTTELFKEILEQKCQCNSYGTDAASEFRLRQKLTNFWKQSDSSTSEVQVLSECNGQYHKRTLDRVKYRRLSQTLPDSPAKNDHYSEETPKIVLPQIKPITSVSTDVQKTTNTMMPVGTRTIMKYASRCVVRKHG